MIDFKYRADVDGLRAVAVLFVLLFHAQLGFSGGFVGVDVFFVISGFLITGLILKEQQANNFRLENFWERRIRRIIPAATVMVIAVLIAGGFILLPTDYTNLAKSAIAQQLMLSNFYFWKHTDYFDGLIDMKPLMHTWSLAIEEQFYLGYPLLLIAIRRLPRWWKLAGMLAATTASLALSQWGVDRYPVATYYLMPTRAWELLLGGMICFAPAPTRCKDWLLETLSWLAMLTILAVGWFYSPNTPCPGVAALVPCGAAAALIYANSIRLTSMGRLLALKPVVFVGLLSYSLYLWHWPILALLRYWNGPELSTATCLLALSASFVIAYLSWRLVELPIRRKGGQTPALWPFLSTGVMALVVVELATLVISSHGYRSRFSNEVLSIVDGSEVPDGFLTLPEQVKRGELPQLGENRLPNSNLDFVIWGDSHAVAVAPLVDRLAKKHQLSGVIAAQSGTVPLLGVWRPAEGVKGMTKRAWNQDVFQYLCDHPVRNIVLASRWAVNINGRIDGTMDSLIVDGESKARTPAESREAFVRALDRTLGPLEERGARIWILGQVPLQRGNPPKRLFYAALEEKGVPKGVTLQQHLDRQANVLKSFSQLKNGFTYLDPVPYCFDTAGYSRIGDGGKSFYFDDNHLSPRGAEALLEDLLDEAFAKMAAEKTSVASLDSNHSAGTVSLHSQSRP